MLHTDDTPDYGTPGSYGFDAGALIAEVTSHTDTTWVLVGVAGLVIGVLGAATAPLWLPKRWPEHLGKLIPAAVFAALLTVSVFLGIGELSRSAAPSGAADTGKAAELVSWASETYKVDVTEEQAAQLLAGRSVAVVAGGFRVTVTAADDADGLLYLFNGFGQELPTYFGTFAGDPGYTEEPADESGEFIGDPGAGEATE